MGYLQTAVLKQRSMSVFEYVAKFNALARFAPGIASTESEKMDKFEEGLKPSLQDMMAAQTYKSYADIVQGAKICEAGKQRTKAIYVEQGKTKGGKKRSRVEPSSRGACSSGHPRALLQLFLLGDDLLGVLSFATAVVCQAMCRLSAGGQ